MAEPSLTDWTTAISTAITGIFAAVAATVSIAAYRRDTRKGLPIVETHIARFGTAPFGRFIEASVNITNRLDETLTIDAIIIREPKGATLSEGTIGLGAVGYGGLPEPAAGTSNQINPMRKIRPAGAYSVRKGATEPTVAYSLPLYVALPDKWSGGRLTFCVFVSSKAETIRHKRIVTKSEIMADTAQKTAAIANKTG